MTYSYNRNTELRHLRTKDLQNLAIILDHNNHWRILMEVIPKEMNNRTFGTEEDLKRISSGAAYRRKYSNEHIRLIENATHQPGESRLHSEILLAEWGSSGRRHERPTLGVLFHLLVQTKHYRAADFIAELLNEPKTPRLNNGHHVPAFKSALNLFTNIQKGVQETSFYLNTENVKESRNTKINENFYTKYHRNIDTKMPTINDKTKEPATATTSKRNY